LKSLQSAESTDPKEPSTPEQKVASTEQKVASTTEQKPASTEEKVTSTTEEQIPIDPNDVNAKTLAQLNTLMEESLQIYELEDQKTDVIDDLHNALQVITAFLGFSTNVNPIIFKLPSDATITVLPNL